MSDGTVVQFGPFPMRMNRTADGRNVGNGVSICVGRTCLAMMGSWVTEEGERIAWRGALAVREQHGADACAFAAERLAFCHATAFADGIVLWGAILEKLTIMTGPPPAAQSDDG